MIEPRERPTTARTIRWCSPRITAQAALPALDIRRVESTMSVNITVRTRPAGMPSLTDDRSQPLA